MMQFISPNDQRLTWAGAVSVHHTDEWSMPWRIPHENRALFPPIDLQLRAAMPAGVRIAFHSDTEQIRGQVVPTAESGLLDLVCNGAHIASVDLTGVEHFQFENLPTGEKFIELWLPQFGEFRLRDLAINEEATLLPHTDTRARWITYGSSITQCRTAASPIETWPAIVARNQNLHLTCLGFGGQCHLDTMIAHTICALPADFLSMCVGINIYGAASLGPRAFRPAIIGFIQTVRTAHVEIPFVVLSPIYSPPRETTPNLVGFTLQDMREEVEAAVETLRQAGDENLHYVNGLTIFDAEQAHLLPDDLHPDAAGYRVMGENFTTQVAEKFFV